VLKLAQARYKKVMSDYHVDVVLQSHVLCHVLPIVAKSAYQDLNVGPLGRVSQCGFRIDNIESMSKPRGVVEVFRLLRALYIIVLHCTYLMSGKSSRCSL